MLAAGCTRREIVIALGVAGPTVDYHASRLRQPRQSNSANARVHAPPVAVRVVGTRQRVAELLAAGLTRAEAARRLGLSKATVSYHARRAGLPVDERCARRYDWAAVQRFYDAGASVSTCCETFGFSRATWHEAAKRGDIRPRPAATPVDQLLVAGRARHRGHIKARLLAAGLKRNACERCGISSWRGEPLSLALHHVNGRSADNRLENLELLCPNCHSQTHNFAGRRRHQAPI